MPQGVHMSQSSFSRETTDMPQGVHMYGARCAADAPFFCCRFGKIDAYYADQRMTDYEEVNR